MSRAHRFVKPRWLAPLLRAPAAGLAVLLVAAPAVAHEIPSDVTVQIIVKPERDRVRLLVRAPLEAMQDVEFPTFGPGYLDVARAERALENAALLWLAHDIEVYEAGRPLPPATLVAARASIPSDRSFAAYGSALAHVLGPPLPEGSELVWQQALLDVLLEAPIESDRSSFSIRPRLERLGLRVVTVVRFVAPGGTERAFRLDGDVGVVELDPRWHSAMLRFVAQGFAHIMDGVDHLLFLLCLVVPLRRDVRALVWVITAFTAGHSVTLLASAFGAAPDALWFPPLVETAIAASILYMAVENVVAATAAPAPRHLPARWAIAAAFGLVHGFGFAFALRESLQLAGDHVLTALLAFNVGIELGQLLVLLVLVPALNLLLLHVVAERVGVIVLSVVVGHVAWHWLAERFAMLREFDVRYADVRAAVADSGLPELAAAVAAATGLWLVLRRSRRRSARPRVPPA